MKAKSIKGKTPSEIQKALDESISDARLPDGYRTGRLPDKQVQNLLLSYHL